MLQAGFHDDREVVRYCWQNRKPNPKKNLISPEF